MTPKEKARELFDLYLNVGMGDGWAKECALICVNEILDDFRKVLPSSRKYWQDVKEEINKL